MEGSWSADLRDSDVAPFALGRSLPTFRAHGEGRYDADPGLARVHLAGRMDAQASRLSVLSPALGRLGAVDLSADFDAER